MRKANEIIIKKEKGIFRAEKQGDKKNGILIDFMWSFVIVLA